MVDIDAAVGFVVARGDAVERARLSYLRTGSCPAEEIVLHAERGQTPGGGWPAQWGGDVASIDATCFRLAELDDLDGLHRPAALAALDWLADRQGLNGFWEEDPALAAAAPHWAKPGDPEARFYLTVNVAYWLAVVSADVTAGRDVGASGGAAGRQAAPAYGTALSRVARAILGCVDQDGCWPGFLVSGWLAAAVLHRAQFFYESARICVVLRNRVPTMPAADAAWMVAALRRAGVADDDPLLLAGRDRLYATQRADGAWPSNDNAVFDVNTTLTALRALR